MANDKHKIRIIVSHNSQTKSIVIDIVIDLTSEFKNGKIVRRLFIDMLNIQVKKLYDMYLESYMKLEYANSLRCLLLVKMLSTSLTVEQHKKIEDILEEYLSLIDEEERKKSYKLYNLGAKRFITFNGSSLLMKHITPF